MHNIGRIIACFVAVLLVVLFPLPYLAQSQGENVDKKITEYTNQLSDEICDKGYLDQSMYEKYADFLDTTGERYDIDIEDIHPVTGDEIYSANAENNNIKVVENTEKHSEACHCSYCESTNDNKLIQISNDLISKKSISLFSGCDILPELKLSNLSTASISKEGEIHSLAAHTHTDDCYAGHRHNSSCGTCLSYYTGSPVTMKVTQSNDIFVGGGFYEDVRHIKCPVCGNTIAEITRYEASSYLSYYEQINAVQWYLRPDNNMDYISTYYQKYLVSAADPGGWEHVVTEYSNDYRKYNPDWRIYSDLFDLMDDGWGNIRIDLLKFNITPKFSCPFCLKDGRINKILVNEYPCGKDQDEVPICDQVVTSITPTQPYQTIIQGESIISTATATYLDGHTGTVNCSVSGIDTNLVGTQTATLTYYGLVGNAKTTGTRTCTVNVTVKSSKTLTSLSVTPNSQIINRNETPSFTVIAYYSDGSNEILSQGEYFVSSTDYSVPGPHTVSISYTFSGVTKSTNIIVYVDALTAITVTPSVQSVERYTAVAALTFTVTASYRYSGNKIYTNGYEINGYSPSVLGEQNITVSYTERGIMQSSAAKINVTVLHRTCPRCHNIYDLNTDDTDPGCPYCNHLITGITVTPDNLEVEQGQPLPVKVNAEYKDGSKDTVTGWTSNYNPNRTGLQPVTVEYGGYAAEITVWVKEATITCPVCGTKYPVSEGKCPVCANTVIRISASPNVVTVNQFDNINLTVTALYADGSSRAVTEWTIDKTTAAPGTFSATITYRNISTKITLNVKSLSAITCPFCGLIYEPSENPRGCPVCSNLLTGIEAYPASGSNLVQYGTTPSLAVVLIFKDTHREITAEDYTIENYDAYKLGKQTIKVNYQDFHVNLEIEVVDTLSCVTCPKGHVYYLNEDGTDPGCPYCRMAGSLSSVYYFDITYLNEILEAVYTQGIYHFEKGNYITVNVTKRDVSLLAGTQQMFFGTAVLGRKKRYVFGGEVS